MIGGFDKALFQRRGGGQAWMEWVWRRKGAGEYRLKFWLQTGAERWATGRNVKEEWGCVVKMGTSWANNRSCQGSGPILCPRLLAPGLGTPPLPATKPSSTWGCFPPPQGGRAQAQSADLTEGLRQPASPPSLPAPRLSPPRARAHRPSSAASARPGNGDLQPSAPAILRAGWAKAGGGVPDRDP